MGHQSDLKHRGQSLSLVDRLYGDKKNDVACPQEAHSKADHGLSIGLYQTINFDHQGYIMGSFSYSKLITRQGSVRELYEQNKIYRE